MPTIYENINKNVFKTWTWITMFAFLILGFGWALSYVYNNEGILIIAFIISSMQVISSYWYSDKIVLSLSGAERLKFKENQEIYRLIENLCIAAGMPMPKVYIIDDQQPNAFATGRDEEHSAIALTKGIINKLTKTELEAVIAHELSHIKNRDTLLQAVIVVLVGLIAMSSDMAWRMTFRSRNNDRKEGNGVLMILGLVLIVLAPIMGKLIQLAVSRKREFLADSSSILLTRNAEALASALTKISEYPNSMKNANTATSHLYILSPLRGNDATSFVNKLFSTHPPVKERIKALLETNN